MKKNNLTLDNTASIMKSFNRFTIIVGTITLAIGVIGSFLPGLWVSLHFDVPFDIGHVIKTFLPLIPIFGVAWFTDGLVYYPVIGLAGTYLGWTTGNVTNLRVPCSIAAQRTAGVEEGTDEGGIISVISIAVSSFVTIIVLAICAIFSTVILSVIPPSVQASFDMLMPALMGASCMLYGLRNPKMLVFAFVVVWVLQLVIVPIGLPSSWVTILAVAMTIIYGIASYNAAKKKEVAAGGEKK